VSPVEPVVQERDIDLVIVTGAGASRAFGVNETQLPLMRDWSERLVLRLRERSPGYLDATGLELDLDAEQFELRLGRFLRAAEAFTRVGHLLDPIRSIDPSRSPIPDADGWNQWHTNAAFQLEQIVAVVHESLYEMFGAPNIDPGLPHQAYSALFRALGVAFDSERRPLRWVYATTNYDRIGELAIHLNGGMPDVGEVTFDPSVAERRLRVEGLLSGMPRHVPVLHLHGSVGWFLRDGTPYAVPVTTYERASGTPIIMLPDLEKTYDNVGIITTLWQQFEDALSRAKRVFILGHSLHDQALIRAVRANVHPLEQVAVTYLEHRSNANEPADVDAQTVQDRVEKELPGAVTIPIRFEVGVDFATSTLRQWLEAIHSLPLPL
jgi:hypothetical protein